MNGLLLVLVDTDGSTRAGRMLPAPGCDAGWVLPPAWRSRNMMAHFPGAPSSGGRDPRSAGDGSARTISSANFDAPISIASAAEAPGDPGVSHRRRETEQFSVDRPFEEYRCAAWPQPFAVVGSRRGPRRAGPWRLQALTSPSKRLRTRSRMPGWNLRR